MVKIDGTKVRSLREANGLTQLYLATSVSVTTDTISRWENKRYPAIKKENALKLAEALDVELDEILEKDQDELTADPVDEGVVEDAHLLAQPAEPVLEKSEKQVSVKKISPFVFAFVAGILSLVWWLYPSSQHPPSIKAGRLLPRLAVPGQPFPVAITVSSGSVVPISLILKEILPAGGSELLATVPPYSAFNSETGEIKWLRKIEGEQVFAYMVKINGAEGIADFDGTVAVHKGPASPINVRGKNRVEMGDFHWADSNGDGRICDEEILVVYDVFSEIQGLGLDVDEVEEIWLGSGYKWNKDKAVFEILP